ncbi:FHA domain-containing protein [Nocardioides KLBMP 9356]|uniref:FHA domain-containing protein n=2 Tax=Nocardioides potassii TaxID=2911371 RepID=A0ABS9HE27_9ACTN|nr:FHA domain-containing protein [Nocardioides potassii]
MPRLLPLPHSHVSGTHLEIRLEGWSVMVADLGSTNGTFLQRPGQPTVRVSETPQLLHSDDVVQLGHGVDLRFEALP